MEYKQIIKSDYFQKSLAVWKSVENHTQITCAVNYTDLAIHALIRQESIPEKEEEKFRMRFVCHLVASEGLPLISETALKNLA